ncbi:MAG TPA: ABC transporter permease [Vicinamibacterales bacterium]|nr:ABC transporter permease [Vicinamibacterales bacterium]
MDRMHSTAVWIWMLASDFVRDLRYSLRLLRRSPLFTAVAVLSLALGIGANAAIFSVADAVIFRKLSVREPDRLFQVRRVQDRDISLVLSYPLYRDVRELNRVFTSTAAAGAFASAEPITVTMPGRSPQEIRARLTVVTGDYFMTLGIEPHAGRLLTPDDDRLRGGHPVAVVSYRFWRRTFSTDRSAAMQTVLTHNGVAYDIVGVAPPGFTGVSSNDDPEVWLPMMMAGALLPNRDVLEARGSSFLYVFGRLAPGLDGAAASADLARVFADVQRIHPDAERTKGDGLSMARGVQSLRARFETPLVALLGIVFLLLLIACVNLAALLLARAAARRHETAIRLSLGASRFRLFRQFLAESLLIATCGGAAGLVVGAFGASLLIALVTTSTRPLPLAFALDSRILLFTFGVATFAALVFGTVPALQSNRTPLLQQGVARTPSRLPGGRILTTAQMALSLFLLIAAGLFARSLVNLRDLDVGFSRENVLILTIDPRPAYGNNPQKYTELYRQLPQQLTQLAGVHSASFADASFFGGNVSRGNVAYEGYVHVVPQSEYPFKVRITPGFPETFGLSLVAGRTFSSADDGRAARIALVSESVAVRYYGGRKAIGKRFCFSDTFHPACAIEIVGIVKDVRYNNVRQPSPFTLYLPIEQDPRVRGDLQVRTRIDPTAMSAQVQGAVRRFNPGLRVVHTTTLRALVEDSIVQDRLLSTLSSAFALLAVILSTVGLYGMTSYDIHRRTREIGVRMALGGSLSTVRWMVLREVVLLAAVGAAIGIPATLAASRLFRSLLFVVSPTDLVTIAGATALLTGTAALAGYLPARRATRLDPVAALRAD